MIKRRLGECGKRRPSKRSKLTEGICSRLFVASSTVLYLKFLLVWALVLLADFMLEFRFEYLWPLWLMMRSVYDSFKFQGLAFSMFFALIALSSDLICFFFIPIHWLFFAASTYVWVQYVWHTDRGVCLPTVSLWLLFVYIEASVRLKELKTPYNLDLCRPFAAHCIGYPVVTLGFGFKSYVSYRLRLRKQREVAKENQFYKELLQQALPQDSLVSVPSIQDSNVSCNDLTNGTSNNHSSSPLANSCTTVISNGNPVTLSNGHQSQVHHLNSHSHSTTNKSSRSAHSQVDSGKLSTGNNKSAANESSDHKKSSLPNGDSNSKNSELFIDKQCMEQVNNHQSNNHNHHRSSNKVTNSINDFDEHSDSQVVGHKMPIKTPINATLSKGDVNRKDQVSTPLSSLVSSASSSTASTKNNVNNVISSTGHVSEVIPPNPPSVSNSTSSSGKKRNDKNKDSNIVTNNLLTPNTTYKSSVKDELVFKLESEVKKLKADLQSSKQSEQELRARLVQATSDDKGARAEIHTLQQNNEQLHQDKENLLTKYNNLVSAMQREKQSMSMLEKKIQEEKKISSSLENQLNNERKARQNVENSLYSSHEHQQSENNVRKPSSRSSQSLIPFSNNTCSNGSSECASDVCKLKRKELECEMNSLRREMSIREEKLRQMEREAQTLRQYKESQSDTELLMSAFSAMQEKTQHLENSLSAETRLKLDLFSALGDAKRQLEISHALMAKKDKEIDELKSKIAEVMAVMPTTSTAYSPMVESSLVSSILFNSSNCKYLHSDAASNTISNSNSNGSHLESALSKVLCEANGTTSLYSPQVVPSDL